ncbi:MAG: organomercurial lyase [Tepidisphaerales bacterium]
MNTWLRTSVVVVLLAVVGAVVVSKARQTRQVASPAAQPVVASLPRLVDLGSKECIPCKRMAPILEEMRKEFDGRLRVEFVDVRVETEAAQKYGIRLIPTQVFFDAAGKELVRHEGFMSREDILAQWAAVGVVLAGPAPTIVRETPLVAPTRPADKACFMCDGDLVARTLVQVQTTTAVRKFCSPHCFFIYLSSLPKPDGIEEATSVTDAATGKTVAAGVASYRYQYDEHNHPSVEASAAAQPGWLKWDGLKEKEFATRCAFCDRACYPEDSSRVKAGGVNIYACCPVCGLGVAARLQKDIEMEVKDAVTGKTLKITTLNGSITSLDPATLTAWHGQKKSAEGKMVSAGCFKQFFFADPETLKKWLDQHPDATGKQASIGELLADKMKLTPQQIKGACKIGDCAK